MVKRVLYEFPHSHFCEKARWALDFKGLTHERIQLLPPWHILVTRRYGKYTSVPLLLDDGKAIQGSGQIISYLDERYPERPLTTGKPDHLLKLEKALDRDLGVSLRAFFYFYCLKHKRFIADAFMQYSPAWQRCLFNVQYPLLVAMIRRSYCPDQKSADAAGESLVRSMEEVWRDLDGRDYYLPSGFSRIDLTICSLLSFVARPVEFPIHWPDIPDDNFIREWDLRLRSHPLADWVSRIYRNHRKPAADE